MLFSCDDGRGVASKKPVRGAWQNASKQESRVEKMENEEEEGRRRRRREEKGRGGGRGESPPDSDYDRRQKDLAKPPGAAVMEAEVKRPNRIILVGSHPINL